MKVFPPRSEAEHLSAPSRLYSFIGFDKSTPPQNRQLIVYYHQSKYSVDDFVGESTFENHSINTLCEMRAGIRFPGRGEEGGARRPSPRESLSSRFADIPTLGGSAPGAPPSAHGSLSAHLATEGWREPQRGAHLGRSARGGRRRTGRHLLRLGRRRPVRRPLLDRTEC